MAIKVKNGTPFNGPSLCETCTHAQFIRGYRTTEELVTCTANYPVLRVPFPVRDCTSYIDKTRQNLCAMERIAWVLAPRGPKRRAGFTPPSEQHKDEEQIELILEDRE